MIIYMCELQTAASLIHSLSFDQNWLILSALLSFGLRQYWMNRCCKLVSQYMTSTCIQISNQCWREKRFSNHSANFTVNISTNSVNVRWIKEIKRVDLVKTLKFDIRGKEDDILGELTNFDELHSVIKFTPH